MSEKDIHGNNYNAHPETARNKWFNYSDAYIDKDGENQPVADYQEQFAQSVNNARDVSDSKDGMRHENNKGTFQALHWTAAVFPDIPIGCGYIFPDVYLLPSNRL